MASGPRHLRGFLTSVERSGAPQYERAVDVLERGQQRALQMRKGGEHLLQEGRLRELGLLRLEKGMLGGASPPCRNT